MSDIDDLRDIVKRDAVRFGKFILSSGKESDLYVDLRMVTLHPRGASLIGRLIFDRIRDLEIDAVGGMSIGADPIAVSVSLAAFSEGRQIVSFLVRKAAKQHGMGNAVEGPVREGMRALIVEDVITTGASTIAAIERAREAGLVVERAIGVLDRLEGGKEAIESVGVKVDCLLTRADLKDEP
ncbi:MAG TPA: orotate phosphoribosyltransferase [Deltaproteobacteria bacterium]|nr:orotate phosphoribosyltransferase [Deltaproteobacteria bacterium]HPP80479.1 orotate phosphoribosyltransferase [Deltaproteobacteria bacterium]